MSNDARVTSVEAVQQFYSAVRIFQDEGESALLALEQQVAKVLAHYDYNLPHFWKGQVRLAFDHVDRARAALETCRMRTVAGHRPSCDEEKAELAAAKRRLQVAQEKVELSTRWAVKLHRMIDEFRAQTGRFKQYMENDVEKMAALLARIVSSLESYLGRSVSSDDAAEPSPPTDANQEQP